MRASVLAALAAGLLLVSPGHAQEKQELQELTKLERQVLDSWKNKDSLTLQKLLRDDYVEIGGPGAGRAGKADVLKAIGSASLADYVLAEPRLVRLNRDAAILVYHFTPQGTSDLTGPFVHPALISSTWVRQDNAWLSAFRQWTPQPPEAARPTTVSTFDTELTPNTLRYTYKGTKQLQDVHLTFDVTMSYGKVAGQPAYFGTWDPGERKEISLGFLAFGVGYIERVDMVAPAFLDGKRVLCSRSARRDAKIGVDLEANPPSLKLP